MLKTNLYNGSWIKHMYSVRHSIQAPKRDSFVLKEFSM